MINLIGHPEQKLRETLHDWGVEPYRVLQIFTWIYHREVRTWDPMTNLSKSLRKSLSEHFYIRYPQIADKKLSKDGTLKYLFRLEDGEEIESVWMPDGDRKTLCISTQAGCRLGCTFCLTGTMGLLRNLTSAEIIGQFMAVNDDLEETDRATNVVLMGMGEPFDNYDELVAAVRLMVSPEALRISTRKVTLSTSGLVEKINRFKTENLAVNLAISLNATEDETRNQIMPINKKYPIKVLMDSLRDYPLKPNRRFTIEYVLLAGINDTDEDAVRLADLLKNIPSKINLIPFNSYDEAGYRPPSEERVKQFQNYLISKNFNVFIRKNRGADILGACGQLAGRKGAASPQNKL